MRTIPDIEQRRNQIANMTPTNETLHSLETRCRCVALLDAGLAERYPDADAMWSLCDAAMESRVSGEPWEGQDAEPVVPPAEDKPRKAMKRAPRRGRKPRA
jgi:hypothetical protein